LIFEVASELLGCIVGRRERACVCFVFRFFKLLKTTETGLEGTKGPRRAGSNEGFVFVVPPCCGWRCDRLEIRSCARWWLAAQW